MSTEALDQQQMQTLGQLLSAGGQNDVPSLLRASLDRLIASWPAQAGALIYQDPRGEMFAFEQGTLDNEATRLIGEAREVFTRHSGGSEPAVGSYALDDGRHLLELSLRNGNQTVGLIHLVVRESDIQYVETI